MMPAITVVLPPEYEPFKHLFESAIHDELSHILGSGMYAKHSVARSEIVNTTVVATVLEPTVTVTHTQQQVRNG